MIATKEVNLPHVVAEVEAVFRDYEQALVNNDLARLDGHFWSSDMTVRFGANENLYGIEAVRKFRSVRNATNLSRRLSETRITTFGEDAAIATTEFERPHQPPGRQTQVWMRMSEGWRIVSAHISPLPAMESEAPVDRPR